jgi:hypothetical protein
LWNRYFFGMSFLSVAAADALIAVFFVEQMGISRTGLSKLAEQLAF